MFNIHFRVIDQLLDRSHNLLVKLELQESKNLISLLNCSKSVKVYEVLLFLQYFSTWRHIISCL